MKSTVRRRQWIGLILAVLLMLPLSGIAAAAEDAGGEAGEPSLMEQLGWKTDAAYPGTTCTLSITDDFGAEGNRSLHLSELGGNWCGMEIVPAEQMEGVTQYVLTMKLRWTQATRLTFRMNSPEGGKGSSGNWTGINWTDNMEHSDFDIDGTAHESATPITRNEDTNDLTIAVDLEAKTIAVWLNDTLVNEREIAYDTASAIYMIARSCDADVDDLTVYEGTPDDAETARVIQLSLRPANRITS